MASLVLMPAARRRCEILASLWVVASLGECDAMQCGIELTVAHPAQPLANAIGRPDGQRRRPVALRERILRMTALYASRFADDLRRRQHTTTLHGEQRWRHWRDQQLDLCLEVVDKGGDFTAASDELAGKARHETRHGVEPAVDRIEMLHMPQSAGWRLP